MVDDLGSIAFRWSLLTSDVWRGIHLFEAFLLAGLAVCLLWVAIDARKRKPRLQRPPLNHRLLQHLKMMGGATITKKKEKQVTELEGRWSVVVFDDPVNLMEYVAKVFQKVFGYSQERAEGLMMTVHKAGKALVWSEEGSGRSCMCSSLQQYQLQASLEKAE